MTSVGPQVLGEQKMNKINFIFLEWIHQKVGWGAWRIWEKNNRSAWE